MTSGEEKDDDLFGLESLKAAARAATPAPDPARRAENLRLAQENFTRSQGSRDAARLTSERPARWGLFSGVINMLKTFSAQDDTPRDDEPTTTPRRDERPKPSQLWQGLTSRGALTATTAVAALAVVMVTPVGQGLLDRAPQLFGAGGPAPEVFTIPVDAPQPLPEPSGTPATAPMASGGDAAPAGAAPQSLAEASGEAPPSADTDTAVRQAAPVAAEAEMAADAREEMPLMAEPAPPPAAAPAPTMRTLAPAIGTLAADGYAAAGMPDIVAPPPPLTEEFANETPNPVKIVTDEPVSTFSIDVDTASWAVIRSSISAGYLPAPDSVRVEEMINYFPYDYAAPEPGDAAPFAADIAVFPTPWNADTELVRIGLQGEMPALDERPPLNLVFLIDTSGSMESANKLPLLRQSFRLMLDELRPEDQVAIVTYAGSAGTVLEPTPAGERSTILAALNRLAAGGSTNGQGGLEQAYEVAERMMEDGEVTRVLLATDGDFNVGATGAEALTDYIERKRDTGVYLSVLGFGRGNLDDATMQALAQNGNGIAAYIDTLSEAQKVLVDQLSGALFPIAGDVKVQVEFNPAVVAEYRLIGYETRALRREDFNNDAVDAGELGAGHSVTAIYEITPVGSPAVLNTPLRYQDETVAASQDASDEIGFLRLRWKEPGESVSQLMETPITQGNAPDSEALFAAAIAGFGQLLRGSDYLGSWGYDEAITLAKENRGEDAFGYRQEAVQLMRLAQSLAR